MPKKPDPEEVRQRTGPCHWPEGCGHRKDQHAEDDKGRPAHCLVLGCPCGGWDPMTTEEWKAVYGHE